MWDAKCCSVSDKVVTVFYLSADNLTCHGCRFLKLAHAECTNCKDIEAVRHPKTYVLVKEVTKEVRMNRTDCVLL